MVAEGSRSHYRWALLQFESETNSSTQRSIYIVVLAMLSLLFSACSSLILGSPFSTPLGGAGYETPPQDEYQRCIHSDYTDECDQQKKLADTYKSWGF